MEHLCGDGVIEAIEWEVFRIFFDLNMNLCALDPYLHFIVAASLTILAFVHEILVSAYTRDNIMIRYFSYFNKCL